MIDSAAKHWTTVCQLTDPAMDALLAVEQALMALDDTQVTPIEFRALLWVRASLAFLYGVRADESMSAPVLAHPGAD